MFQVQGLEDTQQKLYELSDTVQDVNATLRRIEDKMESHRALGPASKDSKHLDKIKVSISHMYIIVSQAITNI